MNKYISVHLVVAEVLWKLGYWFASRNHDLKKQNSYVKLWRQFVVYFNLQEFV